jgi:ribosome maturation factor RimP
MQLHLIDLEIKGDKNKPLYQVFADTEKGVTLDECAQLSRLIQDEIDIDEDFPQKYRLDVSSPGLDKPLIEDFQFSRTIGKDITFQILEKKSKKNIVGKLKSFDKDILILENIKGNEEHFVRHDIGEVKVKLQW